MRHTRVFIALALLGLLAPAGPAAQAPAGTPLDVMSFNIRYGTAKDGDNSWPNRRGMLFDVVREHNADLVGLQEALDFQVDEILAAAPQYAVVGVGRDDGRRAGEYAAILFRKDRLRVAESGTFWFSDTPAVPGTTSWGNTITRICTWARFIDGGGQAFWLFNVHLDHQSQPSRERSAALLVERIAARSTPSEPVIVTGDFNVGEDNPALKTMTKAGLVDTFRALHPDEKPAGTFTGFTFGKEDGEKIDYILVQRGTPVISAAIVRTARGGRYPSDHFPVVSRVALADAVPTRVSR